MDDLNEERPFLAKRLKLLRVTAGLTQQQLAEALHMERCTYTFYETGKSRPDYHLLLRLARIYKVTVDCLIDPDQPLFDRRVAEGPIPPGLQSAADLGMRDKNEREFLVYFRQLSLDQQQEVLDDIIRKLAPSEME